MTRREHMKGLLGLAAPRSGPPLGRARPDKRHDLQSSRAPIPPNGIGRRIRHLSYSDQGGRPDGVQIMVNRRHVYVGHMFSDGVTILDAADPRQLKPVGFFTAGAGTRTHHLQVADDLLLLANGANIVAMQSYDNMRGYFENNLVDSITKRKKFRSGLSIHDISRPAEMKEIAFLEMPGFGINRLWWPGGRYAYVSAHFDGFTDHILCIVDLKDITKPEIVSRWWLPGMNRAAGEKPTCRRGPPGRLASHDHCRRSRLCGVARRRIHHPRHQRPREAQAALAHQLVAAVSRRHAYAASVAGSRSGGGASTKRTLKNARRGRFTPSSWMCARRENPVPISTLPAPRDRDFCSAGVFGPHNLHENRPGSFRSEDTIFATYNNAGVRVFDIKDAFAPKEIASWVPPVPKKLIDPRPNVGLAAKTCDVYVTTEGLMYVSDWNGGMHVLQYEG